MSANERDRRLQEGWRPDGKAMRPTASTKKPPQPPPKPKDSDAAKPPKK